MKILISFFVLFISLTAFSQKVTVIDKSTLQPIENVVLSDSKDPKNSVTTNSLGMAEVSVLKNSAALNIEAEGYMTKITTYSGIESSKFIIQLTDRSYTTDEIVVSTTKFDQDKSTQPQKIDIHFSNEIKFLNQQNSGDLLMSTGDVLVQKSQLGGGSPIIRGLEASRVLIMIDGIRMNNAIFRAGHLQNVLRIDENVLDEI